MWKFLDKLREDAHIALTAVEQYERGDAPAKIQKTSQVQFQTRMRNLCLRHGNNEFGVIDFLNRACVNLRQ